MFLHFLRSIATLEDGTRGKPCVIYDSAVVLGCDTVQTLYCCQNLKSHVV
jgi:hypothetical protein